MTKILNHIDQITELYHIPTQRPNGPSPTFHGKCSCPVPSPLSTCATLCWDNHTQNHRLLGVGKDLCGSSSPTTMSHTHDFQAPKSWMQHTLWKPTRSNQESPEGPVWVESPGRWHRYGSCTVKVSVKASDQARPPSAPYWSILPSSSQRSSEDFAQLFTLEIKEDMEFWHRHIRDCFGEYQHTSQRSHGQSSSCW